MLPITGEDRDRSRRTALSTVRNQAMESLISVDRFAPIDLSACNVYVAVALEWRAARIVGSDQHTAGCRTGLSRYVNCATYVYY
jgi:hypothetical protein